MSIKAMLKRCVFSNFLKLSYDLAAIIWVGNLFHNVGAATPNARFPYLVFVFGTTSNFLSLERSCRGGVYGTSISEM